MWTLKEFNWETLKLIEILNDIIDFYNILWNCLRDEQVSVMR